MRVLFDTDRVRLYCGNAAECFSELPEESVNCVVTSPPYWGLRKYGTRPAVWGGEREHAHEWADEIILTGKARWNHGRNGRRRKKIGQGQFCECGAWLGHLGLEPTPQLYVDHLVGVFRALKPLLKSDGTAWLNLGDSYASGKGLCHNPGGGGKSLIQAKERYPLHRGNKSTLALAGLKPKDLCGVPWRTALALQADGWWLRQDIIWHKPNPMPESVLDR